MVLLIPQAVKKLINKGRTEERTEQRRRLKEALEQFGVEEDGGRVLKFTPEVIEFLNNGDGSSG